MLKICGKNNYLKESKCIIKHHIHIFEKHELFARTASVADAMAMQLIPICICFPIFKEKSYDTRPD